MTKSFGDVLAVEDISFQVADEEIMVLLGPSGCGKSTTLRCIAGLERPDRGKVFINGEDFTDMLPKDRRTAFVFQELALFPHMSVRRNMRFGLDVRKDSPSQQREQKVQEVAELLHIEDLLDRRPAQLSGGQRQRVALGRALVLSPNAFLLDEPFANLDANLKLEFRTETKKLQRQLEIATVFVTHDQEEAMVLGDQILLLKSGSIQQQGSPDSIYNDPQNIFTATFIGSPEANLLEGRVVSEEGNLTFQHPDYSVQMGQIKGQLGEDKKVILGVRPEEVSLATEGTSDQLEARVILVEPLGSAKAVYMETDSGQEIRALVRPEEPIRSGQKIRLSFDISSAWLFDEEGQRIT